MANNSYKLTLYVALIYIYLFSNCQAINSKQTTYKKNNSKFQQEMQTHHWQRISDYPLSVKTASMLVLPNSCLKRETAHSHFSSLFLPYSQSNRGSLLPVFKVYPTSCTLLLCILFLMQFKSAHSNSTYYCMTQSILCYCSNTTDWAIQTSQNLS